MSNSKLIDLYLQDGKEEREIIIQLESIIGLKVDSNNFPNAGAKVFVLPMAYSQGFKQGISIMWSADLNLVFDGKNIAQKLACSLNVPILFDASLFDSALANIDDNDNWFLATPDGLLKSKSIEVLDDGINILS